MSSRIGTPRNVTESPTPEDSSNRQSNSLKLQGKQLNQSELKLLHYYNLSHAAAGTPIGKSIHLYSKRNKNLVNMHSHQCYRRSFVYNVVICSYLGCLS